MTDKRHNDHKHPKVTTTHQDSGSVCACACRTQWSDCIRDSLDGGRENAFVRGDGLSGFRRGSGKVPPSSGEDAAAAAVRQLQFDPHNIERMGDARRFADVGHHRFNGAPSPTKSLSSVKRRKTVSAHVNNNSISRDALLPHIARNLLLAKLAPFLGTFPDTQSDLQYSKRRNETQNRDMLVSHRKHRTRTEEEDSQRKDRHHHRHHKNGHKSDGELERERMRAKLRGGDKEKATGSQMERSSSDRGSKEKATSALPSEGSRRVETDEEKEERRRKRREKKEAGAFAAALARLETDPILSDSKKGHRTHRRDSERKSSRKESRRESERESPRSDKEKQVVLARSKEKDSSKVSTRETLRPGVSSSSRRAESKQRAGREAERSSEHPRPVGEKERDKDKGKESSNDRAVLGFVLEKKQRMVQCVSCLSDDVPRNQAAHLTACGHYFCNECLKRIFTLSLTDPALMPPKCCNSDHIPLKYVDRLLSYSTKKQWNKKYNEYTSSNRIYCPTKDCGHWISPKYISGKIGQCSRCKVKVCTMCNGRAHGASECPEDEDLKAFIKTAKENGYQKCYRCTAVVELKSGCNHITCRCTAEFCYRCGEKWKTCDCPWFAYPDSEEDEEDEQADAIVPVRAENEAAEQRRREEMQQQEEQERREREAQIARDEALARQLAQASLFQDKETFEKLNGNGSLRTGLRNSYKKLAEEYAEERRRDEEAKEERVRDRLQKLRDRDSARRGSTSSNRESSRPSTARHERRHSEPRPSTSRGSHSRPQTAQALQTPPSPLAQGHHEEDATQRRIFDDERAARIAKYIMGELDELDDETAAQPGSPVDEPAGSSSFHHRSHGEKHRRGTVSGVSARPSSSRRAEYGPDGRPISHTQQYHSTSKSSSTSFFPGSLPRLETPRYAASSVLADVSFPLENEKPSRSSSSHTRAGKIRENYIHANTKSAPTSPMHSTPPSILDNNGSSRRNYLAELGYKFLKHQQHVAAPHSAYPLNYGSHPNPAPAYTYSYTSYSGFGAGADESSRARQFTHNWGGIEAMGPTWKEPFVDRLELSSRAPRVGAPRTTSY